MELEKRLARKTMTKKSDSTQQPESETADPTADVKDNVEQKETRINDGKASGQETETGVEAEQSVQQDAADLQKQLDAERDRLLRLSAELDNFKKRSAKEMEDFRKFANETLFKQLLTVMDNLERAIDSGRSGADADALLKGIELTHKEMLRFFEKFQVRSVEAMGKPFDPALHQAVTQQESSDHPDNTVMNELQKGYTLHDRLIRPSMVVVSKAATEQNTAK